MSGDLATFAEELLRAAGALGHPATDAVAEQIRNTAGILTNSPSHGARDDWAAAVSALGGDRVRIFATAWGLPSVPGDATVLSGIVARALAGDRALLSGADADLHLGPLSLDVDLPALLVPLGDHPLVAALLAPSGLAATVPAGPVTVDGGVEKVSDGWVGTLGASIGVVSAGALAELTDRDGDTAFASILGASFTPGIQLGFGFEISALGGVVGVNRGLDPDSLRAELSSGHAVALFFPASPGDATERAARMRLMTEVFKVRAGSVVAGPSAELNWLRVASYSMLRLSVVALLELPRARFVLLGRAAVAVPVVLDLELDLLGEVDPAAGVVAVDLAVVSGRMFGLMRVDGTAALRVHSADPTASLFTVGGFYPGYRADVPGLPPQRRISMGSDLPLPISLRFEGYFAITDGTFQAGARIELGFQAGVEVHGFLQFDAIGQYDPFHVHAELVGGVDVGALGTHFGGVDFHGVIDGPGPVVISGRVEVELLFVSAGWSDSYRLGIGSAPPADPPLEDLAGLAVVGHERAPEHRKDTLHVPPGAVTAGAADDPLVDVQPPPRDEHDEDLAVLRPLGEVTWSQSVVPFDTPISRVRGRRLANPHTVSLSNLTAGVSTGPTEQFAPAALCDADRDTLLTLPAYERMPSGVRVTAEPAHLSGEHKATLSYQEFYKNEDDTGHDGEFHAVSARLHLLLGARHDPPTARYRGPGLTLEPEAWGVLVPAAAGAPIAAPTRTAAVLGASAQGGVALPLHETALRVADLWRP